MNFQQFQAHNQGKKQGGRQENEHGLRWIQKRTAYKHLLCLYAVPIFGVLLYNESNTLAEHVFHLFKETFLLC